MGMTSKNRHDVSVKGPTFDAIRAHCDKIQVSVGEEVSHWIDEHFDNRERDSDTNVQIRKHFTF
jgi:hypothetical protein